MQSSVYLFFEGGCYSSMVMGHVYHKGYMKSLKNFVSINQFGIILNLELYSIWNYTQFGIIL